MHTFCFAQGVNIEFQFSFLPVWMNAPYADTDKILTLALTTFWMQDMSKLCTWLNLWAHQQVRAGSGSSGGVVHALEKPGHLVSSDGSTTQHPATCFFQHRLSVRGRHMEPTNVMEPFSGRHMFWGRHMEPKLCYRAFFDVTRWDSGYLLVRILDHIFSFLVSICAPIRLVPKPK